jgi:Tfp pilus assembly pilus retraction ATPase PilT
MSDKLSRLLSDATSHGASDLHLVVGVPPAFRVHGEIIFADADSLSGEDSAAMAYSLLNQINGRNSTASGSYAFLCRIVSPDGFVPRFTSATRIPR